MDDKELNSVEDEEILDDDEEKLQKKLEVNDTRNDDNEFREKIISMFKIVLLALVIILVLGFIISLFTRKKYTYSSVEDVMKNAAIDYFKDNSGKLPKTDDQIVQVGVDVLVNGHYMKKLDHYLKEDNCSGKVNVERATTTTYNYTPILSCGKYTTTALVDVVRKKDNIVNDGYGVYYINNEYVYRGLKVDNYVKFNDSSVLWRIVKVNSDNEAVLISDTKSKNKFPWDSRYNNSVGDTSGIGIFNNSEISSILNSIYNNTLDDEDNYYSTELSFLTNYDKTKVVEFDSCVGTRSEEDTTKDGSTECAVQTKTKMSLLPVYDFMNASIDSNCISSVRPDCQNYNYLNSNYAYWLANGSEERSNRVYAVSSYVYSKVANASLPIRPVIHLNQNAMVEKGKGTITNPYIIR